MPADSQTLLRILDIQLLSSIKVMCGTIDNTTNGRKFDAQTRQTADSQNCRVDRVPQTKPDAGNMSGGKTNIPNYLNSTTIKTHARLCSFPVTTKKLTK